MEFLIALLLIRRTNSFRNSYELSKVMAWKFGLIEFNIIMAELINNSLVTVETKNLINHYEITDLGVLYIENYSKDFEKSLIAEYPKEEEFIKNLISIYPYGS
jgi:hypothetical protein